MTGRWSTGLVLAFTFCIFTLAEREATAVVWPTAWFALPDPCTLSGVYTEPHDDFPGAPGLHEVDIVGSDAFPAGFRYTDGTDLFFRMRVDKASSTPPQAVWQFLLDTDLDSQGYVNYSLQLDNKVDNAVEFIPATSGGPLFAQVTLTHTPVDGHWSGTLATYSQIIADTGDTNLGGLTPAETPNDSYIDVAIPWSDFTAKTGIAYSDTAFYGWRVYLTTSASHIAVNQDTPNCEIPEPSTFALLLGAVGMGVGLWGVSRGYPMGRP